MQEQPGKPPEGMQGRTGRMEKGKATVKKDKNVRQAQEKLKEVGFDPGPIDGILGPRTGKALRGFQQSNNLKATGKLDTKTRQTLMAAKEKMPESSPSESAPKSKPGEPTPGGSMPGTGSSGTAPSGSPGSRPPSGSTSGKPPYGG